MSGRTGCGAIWLAAVLGGAATWAGEPAADEAKRYTMEECIRIGLARSAVAVNARRDEQIAGAQVTQARSAALPHLALNGSYTRLDEVQSVEFGGQQLDLGSVDNYSAKAEVSQLLYSGGKVAAALAAASLAEQHAGWMRAEAESRLERDIRTGFCDILLARAAAGVREESLAQIESLLVQTERRLASGAASEFEVLTAKVRVANEKPELIRARNLRDVATEGFRRLIGIDDKAFEIEGELVCEPWNEDLTNLCRTALLCRPAVRAMDVASRLKEQDLAAGKAGFYPSVNSYFNYDGASPYGFAATSGDWQWHWTAGLNLRWDLWDGDLTRGVVRQKRLELDKMRTDLEDFRKAVELEVTQAYLDMRRALDTIEAGRGNVALAQKALGIAKTRYDTGLATYLDFTDANLALRTSELTLYNALRDHMNAVARLRYAAGIEGARVKKENP